MIILECEQGTDEWYKARLGIPTASMMGKIITIAGKKSSSWADTRNKLIAERVLGRPLETFSNEWMERGKELEPKAAMLYQLHHDVELREAGFCYMDESKQAGFSPDRLMPSIKRGLEIKCPSPGVHIGYHLSARLPGSYVQQVYSSLYMSGYDTWDFMSYHPEIAPFYFRISKDDTAYQNFITSLMDILPDFIEDLNTTYERAYSLKLKEAA